MTSWIWAVRGHAEPITLHNPLPADHMAFINGGTGTNLWGLVHSADDGADRLAAGAFVAIAQAGAAAAPAGRPIAITGDGLLAYLLGHLLSEHAPATGAEPSVIIDTTGSPPTIQKALATLPRLGHLVLAAPPRDVNCNLATYQDLHVRALTVTGVGPTPATARTAADDAAIDEALRLLVRVAPGHTVTDGGVWYAIPGQEST